MDREAWHAAVHGVTKSQTRLRNFHFPKEKQTLKKSVRVLHFLNSDYSCKSVPLLMSLLLTLPFIL